jgi:flagellar hook-basal body complex protein FliE
MGVGSVGGINPVSPSIFETSGPAGTGNNSSVSFADILKGALDNTNDMIIQAEDLADQFAAGKIDNMDQVLVASEKADIALQFTWAIRNKIMDAYSEIMRMQI